MLSRGQLARFSGGQKFSLVRRAITQFQAIAKPESPHPDCPLVCVDSHYVLKPGAEEKLPLVKKLDYVDSLIKWRNFHSDEVEVVYLSDYDKCTAINSNPGSKLVAFWVPNIVNSSMCDDDATTECQEWLVNEWPMYSRAEDIYSKPRLQFAQGVARVCAGLNGDRDRERRHLTYLITGHTFWFDDVNERMIQQPDPHLFVAWRQNLNRIVNLQEDRVSRIPLEILTNFPKDEVVRAKFCEDVMRDIIHRLKKMSPQVLSLYQRSFHYFMDHVALEGKYRHVADHWSDVGLKAKFIEWKSGISAVTMTTVPVYTDVDADLMSVQDPFLVLAEITVTCEGDAMSFFKENMNGQRMGNVSSNANIMDWNMQVAGMDVRQGFAANAGIRNDGLMAMSRMHACLNPRDQTRAMSAMRNVVNLGDYQIRLGVDQLNPRYGWYPVLDDGS